MKLELPSRDEHDLPPDALKGVVFDMDGLLLASEERAKAAWQAAAVSMGLCLSDDAYVSMIGRSASDCDRVLIELIGRPELVDELRRTAYASYIREVEAVSIPLKLGVHETLDLLDELALPRAVATSTAEALARKKLERVGILDRLGTVIGGDQVEHGKPYPDIYLAACKRLGVEPLRCLAFEDSPAGIEAAHRAGLMTVLVPDLVQPDKRTKQFARWIRGTLLDAMPIVRALARKE
jgi:HAD superfamily hydrolase (TIGR01509 family)